MAYIVLTLAETTRGNHSQTSSYREITGEGIVGAGKTKGSVGCVVKKIIASFN